MLEKDGEGAGPAVATRSGGRPSGPGAAEGSVAGAAEALSGAEAARLRGEAARLRLRVAELEAEAEEVARSRAAGLGSA